MLYHLMNRPVLGRKHNSPQKRSEHREVQTLYTDSDNDMSHQYRDPSLVRKHVIKYLENDIKIETVVLIA